MGTWTWMPKRFPRTAQRPSSIVVARFARIAGRPRMPRLELFLFRDHDGVTGRWVRARLRRKRHEITARYIEWRSSDHRRFATWIRMLINSPGAAVAHDPVPVTGEKQTAHRSEPFRDQALVKAELWCDTSYSGGTASSKYDRVK